MLTATVVSETKFNYVTIIFDLIKNVTTEWKPEQLRISVEKSKLKKVKLSNNEIIPGSLITSIDKVGLGMLITNGLINKDTYFITQIDKEKNVISFKLSSNASVKYHNENLVEVGSSRFRYALPE